MFTASHFTEFRVDFPASLSAKLGPPFWRTRANARLTAVVRADQADALTDQQTDGRTRRMHGNGKICAVQYWRLAGGREVSKVSQGELLQFADLIARIWYLYAARHQYQGACGTIIKVLGTYFAKLKYYWASGKTLIFDCTPDPTPVTGRRHSLLGKINYVYYVAEIYRVWKNFHCKVIS